MNFWLKASILFCVNERSSGAGWVQTPSWSTWEKSVVSYEDPGGANNSLFPSDCFSLNISDNWQHIGGALELA